MSILLQTTVASPGALIAIAVFVVLMLAVTGVNSAAKSSRRKSAAINLGFVPVPESDPEFRDQVLAFYQRPWAKYRLNNVFAQRRGGSTVYSYDLYSPAGRRNPFSPTLAVISSELTLPAFGVTTTLRSGANPGKLGRAVLSMALAAEGEQFIDFSARPEFADRYSVAGQDETSIRRALSPAIDWLVQIKDENGMNLVQIAAGNGLLAWSWHSTRSFRKASQAEALQISLNRLLTLFQLLGNDRALS